jgi:hypothetical protein
MNTNEEAKNCFMWFIYRFPVGVKPGLFMNKPEKLAH